MKASTLASLILALSLLLCPAGSLAEENPLSGIVIEDGWMRGTATAHFLDGPVEITIDCPVPEEPYPAEVLTMATRSFSKKDMQRALRAIGQSDQGKFVSNREGASFTRKITEREAAADISREDASEQAVAIGLAYFDALGVEIDREHYYAERPNDLEANTAKMSEYYSHIYSDPSVFVERSRAQYIRTHRYETTPPCYTMVIFRVMVDGMRLAPNAGYPAGYADEPGAWIGTSICASVTVSDSGMLTEAYASGIPEIKSRRPATDADREAYVSACMLHSGSCKFIAAEDGWSALLAVLADSSRMGTLTGSWEDSVFQDERMTEPMTQYGARGVVTGIKPYLFTLSEHEWMPVWKIESAAEYADGWRSET